jgi:hypothetical protein
MTKHIYIVRLGVLAFLLYLRLSYLPLAEDELTDKPGELEFNQLDETGKQLLITWEFLFIAGTCLLFTASSLLLYKWRHLLTRDSQGNTVAVVVLNLIVYIPCIILIGLQYLLSYYEQQYLWIHTTYYYIGAALVGAAFLLTVNSTRLATTLEHDRVRNDYTLRLYKLVLTIRFSSIACVIVLLVRAGSLTLDSIGYRYMTPGSTLQHVWNLFFKYILWITPEFLFCILLCHSFFTTEDFHGMLAMLANNNILKDVRQKFFNIEAPRAQPASERVNVTVERLSDVVGGDGDQVKTIPSYILEQTIVESYDDDDDVYSENDHVELVSHQYDYRLIRDE